MNDQIRKLAIKSGIDIRGHLTGDLTLDEKPSVIDLSKFAESIVRECCEVINAGKVGYNQVPAEVALDLTAKNVNAYFGVE